MILRLSYQLLIELRPMFLLALIKELLGVFLNWATEQQAHTFW